MRSKFKSKYKENIKYAPFLPQLEGSTENGIKFPFKVNNGLIFNIKINGIRKLYILYNLIKRFLKKVYDNKYYFNCDKILYELKSVTFLNKIY